MKNVLIYYIIAISFISLSACSSLQPVDDSDISRLERQLAATNQEIEEIYDKMSTIQSMVGDHQRAILKLEDAIEKQSSTAVSPVGADKLQ